MLPTGVLGIDLGVQIYHDISMRKYRLLDVRINVVSSGRYLPTWKPVMPIGLRVSSTCDSGPTRLAILAVCL